jgi:hypothetical protein
MARSAVSFLNNEIVPSRLRPIPSKLVDTVSSPSVPIVCPTMFRKGESQNPISQIDSQFQFEIVACLLLGLRELIVG